MKKLMFATALVASAAAFGAGEANAMTALNAIGFEGCGLGSSITTGAIEKEEDGLTDKAAAYGYFCFEGESDSSVVTNETPSTTKRTTYFKDDTNAKYLQLDTEGGKLWRSIDTLNRYQNPEGEGYVYSNGTARAVAETGTYLDTLVQFTVTEDEEPTVGTDDKLAIWLGVETNGLGEVTGTNLFAKAGLIDDQGGTTPMTFKLNGTVNPGVWYRLTVKALADITDSEGLPGFQIYLDGNLLTSSTPTLTSEYLEILGPDDADDSHYADIVAGKYFASLKTATTIQAVGFQGTGAVDEIVWTEDDPFAAGGSGVDFTLTGAENATVAYAIDGGATETWDGSTAITVPANTDVTFTATPTNNFTYAGVTAEGWTVSGNSLVCTTNAAANITLAVPNAVAITYTLTVPAVANATLTSPASLSGFAPGQQVTLTWTADPGYSFNGSRTKTLTVTVNGNEEVNVSEITSALSKDTFTVTIVDIENVTVVATTNDVELSDALSENTLTNLYMVEYNDAVTVTVTPDSSHVYASAPDGWTLSDGAISITTNVTEALTLAVPKATAQLEPGQQDDTKYDSVEEATDALGSVTIVASAEVTNALDSTAQETYKNRFEKKVVQDENTGKYVIEIGLKAAEEADLQDQADDDAGTLVEDFDKVSTKVDTTPGFYYSIKWGTSLGNMNQQTPKTLATGSTLTLDIPKGAGATSGFYKVVIDVTR